MKFEKTPIKTIFLFSVVCSALFCLACTKSEIKPTNIAVNNHATLAPTPATPKDGNYNGKGTVTKINLDLVSVELKHDNIEGLMPAMQMEFYVTDKALLKGLAIGDSVSFVIEYKGGRETINSIKKAP